MALQVFSYFLVLFLLIAVARGQEDTTTEKALDNGLLSVVTGSDHTMVERTCLDTLRIGYDSQLTTEHPVHIGSNCSDLCISPEGPVSEGKFPHPGDCRAYIHCQNWEAEAVLCPDFHYFDTTTHECVQAASDDETRREQCKLRVFTTKSPTTTEATLTTTQDLSTTETIFAAAGVTAEILHEKDEVHSTAPPVTPPEKYMKGVVVKVIRPQTSTQLVESTTVTELTTTTSAQSTILIAEVTSGSMSTTTEESTNGSISTTAENPTTERIPTTTTESTTGRISTTTEEPSSRTSSSSTTRLTTTQLPTQASHTTEVMVKTTTNPFLLLLAGSSSARTTVRQLPVTTTSEQTTVSTTTPLTTTTETSILIAGKIPEFKRSRYYLPGTLYRPPVIQRPKKP